MSAVTATPAPAPEQQVAVPIEELMQAAVGHEQAGRLDEAEKLLNRIVTAAPKHPHALHLMGVVAFRRKRVPEAVALMEQSIQLGGDRHYYFRNLCEGYRLLGRYDDALAAGNRALALAPNDPTTLINLGILHFARLELNQSIAYAERAIEIDPKLPSAHFQLAEVLLLQGNMERGWEEYEWRFQIPGAGKLIPKTDQPQWDGKPFSDAPLMLIADQGFGDAIQFCRYIPWAASRCPNLIMACSPEMRPLLAQQPGVVRTFDRWEQAGPFAAYCPLTGLPRLAGTRVESIPDGTPYLKADPAKSAAWGKRLDELVPKGNRRIAICWAGRPTHNNDHNRTIGLQGFSPLGDIPGVSLISLQKWAAQSQVAQYFGRAPLFNMGPEIGDYEDTMAILENVDLLVTVDTSVGHLAGAMGRPAWIMIPYAPDWRWLLGREDTPWYPSVRLFRQEKPKQWPPVIARVAAELRAGG